MKKKPYSQKMRQATAGLAFALAINSAQAITIPDTPLIIDTGEAPNLMMILDTSGSMTHVVVDAPYDENTTYGSCSNSNKVPTSDTITLTVASDGTAQFNSRVCTRYRKNGSCRKWSDSTVSWANDTAGRCFGATDTYDAIIMRDSQNYDFEETVSGNYLNWYFSNAVDNGGVPTGPDNFGVGAEKKPEAPTRLEVMQNVMKNLLNNTITNTNVGLVSFDTSSGYDGEIEYGLVDIDAGSNRNNLITRIDSFSSSGGTPLAGALAQVGRYYVQGKNGSLVISSPNVTSPQNAYSLFNEEPDYASGVSKPTNASPAIANECQSSYSIVLSDGEPSQSDGDYSAALAKWDDNDDDRNQSSNKSDFDDVAAALFDTDLRPDLPGNQNVTSYVVGFELNHPLLDAAASAGGGQYFTATDTASLQTALTNAFYAIQAQVGSIASVAFNSSQLDTGSAVFQAKYDTGDWSGTLEALPLDGHGNVGNAAWEAGNILGSMNISHRNIFTYDSTANSGAGEGIEFTWANLNASQKADLYQSVDVDGDGNSATGNATNDDDDAQDLLDYLRGDRGNEGSASNQFRTRSSLLGDIVNSTPIYVGKPEMNWPEYSVNNLFGASGAPYSAFKNSTSVINRTPVVYVGSNDGMLHGFNASLTGNNKGKEEFAYIPGALFSSSTTAGLHYLANQNYAHKFYTDLTPAVSDVYIKRSTSGTRAWRTVLAGGLRGGGKGIFALDVSDPSEFNNNNIADDLVLWEFTAADDPDFGYSYSVPSIAMMANGKWAVITGNGYNSANGNAKLFILFIEEGIDGWAAGDYIELDTGVGSDNGLASPRLVDLDADMIPDVIYAGDLKGNMWAFNVSSNNTADWSNASNIRKLFTATDGSSNPQPITSSPVLALNPNSGMNPTASSPNLLVLFGTGKYLESSDNGSTDRMTYYAVWDKGDNNLDRSDLEPREMITANNLRTVNGNAVNWNSQYGWYMDLVNRGSAGGGATDEGERVVSDSLLRRSVLFFNTLITNTANCATTGGGWLMSLDFDSGLAPSFAVFDANGDGTIDSSDLNFVGASFQHGLPSKSGILGEKQYTPGTDGTIDTRDINVGTGNSEGRLSWIEHTRE